MNQAATALPIWGQFLIEFCKLLVSALLSAFVAVKVVNRLKSRSDHLEKRIDDICSDIRAVADLASEYWMKPASNDLKALEAKIQARIRLVEELRGAVAYSAPELGSDKVVDAAQSFLRHATGGDFGVHNRSTDVGRSASTQHTASRYIAALRRERLASVGGKANEQIGL